jgi:hypothetical protein
MQAGEQPVALRAKFDRSPDGGLECGGLRGQESRLDRSNVGGSHAITRFGCHRLDPAVLRAVLDPRLRRWPDHANRAPKTAPENGTYAHLRRG